MRSPGNPYAFDRPLVTITRSCRPHIVGPSRPSRSAQRRGAVRLRVAQRFGEQRLARGRIVGELAERQRMDAALREVEVDLVLVGRLHALQCKRVDSHGVTLPFSVKRSAWSPGLY